MEVLGRGNEAIYVYHFKNYEDNTDDYFYPCKVGMSKSNVINRIKQQVQTSSPEQPIIDLVVFCDNGRKLESAIHAILKLYNREIKSATGIEWFNTTGDEIKNLCSLLRII